MFKIVNQCSERSPVIFVFTIDIDEDVECVQPLGNTLYQLGLKDIIGSSVSQAHVQIRLSQQVTILNWFFFKADSYTNSNAQYFYFVRDFDV